MPEPLVFVLQHTHWDREWYHPAVRFRKRLVDLIDERLSDAPNGTFLLDGQAIVLRDYLAVRPERAAELSAALQRGNLEAGPWYVLPDELIPSGEALVRNLLAGRRALRALRAEAPPILYCPDSFGHPASLPAIAAGFGCAVIIAWRGYGSNRFPKGDAARWIAPDGTESLLFHLPPDGYEFGSNLPTDHDEARRRWSEMRKVLQSRSALGVLLVMNGADHHAPQDQAAIDALEYVTSPFHTTVGGLAALAHLLHERARSTHLPQVAGELRDSYGYTWTLQGTFGTRAHQKRTNALIERDLIRDVEPWTALARMAGAPSARHHVSHAWETLLATHPHDSLCGCSIDAVAEAVEQRQNDSAALAAEVRESALARLIGHDADASRARSGSWHSALIVRNRAARARAGVAEVDLDIELALVPVGPGSAGKSRRLESRTAPDLPLQIISREHIHARIEAPRYYPINHAIERRRALVWLPEVPGYGLVAFPLDGDRKDAKQPASVVRADARGIHGETMSLTRSKSGIGWRHRQSKRAVSSLIGFEMVGERGDTYTHSPVPRSLGRGAMVRSRVALRGPLRAAIDSTWRVRRRGTPPRDALEVTVRASLDAGTEFVRLHVHGVNWATDHRLRLVIRTGMRPRKVLADAAFALIERKPLRVPAQESRVEAVPGTDPLHRFVSLFDGKSGCTVISDGLAEYEVLADGSLAITLVRAVGDLSRVDLPERPGHAGWPVPTPGAQCIGAFEGAFAVYWHAGDSDATRASIQAVVEDVLLPLAGHTQRDLTKLPGVIKGVTLVGTGLAFSTLKESEDGRYIVARCVNVTDSAVDGAWILPHAISAAYTGRLDETPGERLPSEAGSIPITVGPRGIHTVLLS